MSNSFNTVGAVTFIALRDTSLYMTVKEDSPKGSTLRVKAFCPREQQQAPEIWAAQFKHLAIGSLVWVEGSLSFDKATRVQPASGERVDVPHPTTGHTLYEPYIWAHRINELFNPMVHTVREGNKQRTQDHGSAPAPAPRRPAARPPEVHRDDDDLPTIPDTTPRANVAWNP